MNLSPKSRNHFLALSLYVALVTLFFAPVVFSGKTLLPSLYQPHGVLAEGSYTGGRLPVNSFNVDIATPAYYEFPINKLVGDLYKSGELPLWNPYQGGGTPLAAQYSTRTFFPYQILENISPVGTWDFFMLGRLVIAGFLTYLFLAEIGLPFAPAFAGGAFYMLSGTFVWFINLEQYVDPAMTLPLVMYAVELLAKGGAGFKKGRIGLALSGISFGFLLLAGQPEVALYISFLAFLYFMFRAFSLFRGREVFSAFLKFSASYAIGLAIAMPLILPFGELVKYGYHIHPSGGNMGIQNLNHWKTIFAVFSPTFAEFPAVPEMINGVGLLVKLNNSFYRFLPINGVWDMLGGYTGILLAFIIITGILYSTALKGFRWKGHLLFFSIYGIFLILKNIGLPPFLWIGYLPLFDQVWTLRWAGPTWIFALSAAGAIALQAFNTPAEKEAATSAFGKYFSRKPSMAPVWTLLVLLGFYIVLSFIPVAGLTIYADRYFNQIMKPFVWPSMFIGSVVTMLVAVYGFIMSVTSLGKERKWIYGLIALGVIELWWAVPRGYDPQWLNYKWIPFSAGLLAVFFFYREELIPAFGAFFIFFAAFLYLDAVSPYGFPERQDPFKQAPYVEFLKGKTGEFRSAGLYGVLFPNFASAIQMQDIRYVNSVLSAPFQNYRRHYLHVDEFDEGPSSDLWFSGRPERCRAINSKKGKETLYDFWLRPVEEDIAGKLRSYSLFSVKYLLMPKKAGYGVHEGERFFKSTGFSGFPLVYEKEVNIYENPSAAERAFVAYDVEYADTYEKAQEAAAKGTFDLMKKAVLEKRIDLKPAASGEAPQYKAEITEYRANKVKIRVSSSGEGVLVLTDLYYPGWKVSVNGSSATVLRVDGIIRGVKVPKGDSEVVFSYLPSSFLAGASASAAGFILCGFLIYSGRRKDDGEVGKL